MCQLPRVSDHFWLGRLRSLSNLSDNVLLLDLIFVRIAETRTGHHLELFFGSNSQAIETLETPTVVSMSFQPAIRRTHSQNM